MQQVCSCLTDALLHGHLLDLPAVSLRSSLHIKRYYSQKHLHRTQCAYFILLNTFNRVFGNQTSEVSSLPPQVTAKESPRPIWQSGSEKKHRSAARRHLQKTLCPSFSFPVSASFRTQHLSFHYFAVAGKFRFIT